jgi:hypothetical protein
LGFTAKSGESAWEPARHSVLGLQFIQLSNFSIVAIELLYLTCHHQIVLIGDLNDYRH